MNLRPCSLPLAATWPYVEASIRAIEEKRRTLIEPPPKPPARRFCNFQIGDKRTVVSAARPVAILRQAEAETKGQFTVTYKGELIWILERVA